MSKLELLAVDPLDKIQVEICYRGKDYCIRSSNTVKYLGVTFEPSLYMDSHITAIIPELKRRTSILRGLCWNSPTRLYRQMYVSTIRSKIAYCGNLITYSNNLRKLETIQNDNLRFILRAFMTSPVLTLRTALNLPALQTYAQYLKACFSIHLAKSSVQKLKTNPRILSPVDEGDHMINQNFQDDNEPSRKKLKELLRQDMVADYSQYDGYFRTVFPDYPSFQLFRSPGITSAAYRLATSHLNIGSHRSRLKLKGPTKCRHCQNQLETVNHLLSHYGYRSRHSFLELLRGSRGTHVDRIRLFKLVQRLRL